MASVNNWDNSELRTLISRWISDGDLLSIFYVLQEDGIKGGKKYLCLCWDVLFLKKWKKVVWHFGPFSKPFNFWGFEHGKATLKLFLMFNNYCEPLQGGYSMSLPPPFQHKLFCYFIHGDNFLPQIRPCEFKHNTSQINNNLMRTFWGQTF